MELIEGVLNRRSIRKFTDRHIADEELHTILRAAMTGPTCANTRDWSFLVVRDKEMLKKNGGCQWSAGGTSSPL